MASFQRFLQDGTIGQLALGMDQVECLVYLGDPPNFIGSPTIIGSNVWVYGDLELEFHRHAMTRMTIRTSSRTDLPNEVGNSIGFPTSEWTEDDLRQSASEAGVELVREGDAWLSAGATFEFQQGCLVTISARPTESSPTTVDSQRR